MSRKNRNARSNGVRQHQSFANFNSTTMRFDLSKGSFITKTSPQYNKANECDELKFSINHDNSKGKDCISLSFRDDVAKMLIKHSGNMWACGIVTEGGFERFYMIPDEMGYKLTTTSGSKRYYMKMPIVDDNPIYEKYRGCHALKFDNYNDAYYITDDE